LVGQLLWHRCFAMVHYRIYTVGKDGHFGGPPEEMECADDREVVATAMQMRNGLDMEIWDHKRFVIRLMVSAQRSARQPSN
jgi:hypothetical protein